MAASVLRTRWRRRLPLVVLLLAAFDARAFAQGPYVAASIGEDVVRFSGDSVERPAGSGEAVSWSLRVGTPVASHFGVELEFVRPQEVVATDAPTAQILGSGQSGALSYVFNGGSVTPGLSPVIFPPITVSIRTAQRNVTLGTTMWARQQISPRFSMVYLGGVGFTRTTQEFTYSVSGGLPNIFASLVPRSHRLIDYSTGPIVGTDARVGMTDHLQLIPGVRLQSLGRGWIVRPAVALGWQF